MTLASDHIRESDCLTNGLFHLKVQLNAELKDTNLNFFFLIILDGKGPYMSSVDLQKKTILTRGRLKMISEKKFSKNV